MIQRVRSAVQSSFLALLSIVLVLVIAVQLVPRGQPSSLNSYPFAVASSDNDTLIPWNCKAESLEQAAERLSLPLPVRVSMFQMARADEFARGLVGEQARPAPAETTITLLAVQRNATDIFMAILLAGDSTNEGRMLALTGLMQTDRQLFLAIVDRIRNSPVKIRWQSGCTRQIVPASECIAYLHHWHRRGEIGN